MVCKQSHEAKSISCCLTVSQSFICSGTSRITFESTAVNLGQAAEEGAGLHRQHGLAVQQQQQQRRRAAGGRSNAAAARPVATHGFPGTNNHALREALQGRSRLQPQPPRCRLLIVLFEAAAAAAKAATAATKRPQQHSEVGIFCLENTLAIFLLSVD